MIDIPRTKEEARKYRYGEWAGNPKGTRYYEDKCAYEVWGSRGFLSAQCSKKNGHGPDGLYCKVHARRIA